MASTFKVLGQADPLAATLTTAYTVPLATEAVVSSLVVANRSATPTSFRIAISPGGAGVANEHYIYYDVAIAANDVFAATLGIAMEASSIVRVYATLATLSFNIYGS